MCYVFVEEKDHGSTCYVPGVCDVIGQDGVFTLRRIVALAINKRCQLSRLVVACWS
jgi:hypothetical protein